MAGKIRYIKQLSHDDGEAFVLWHPDLEVYCPVLCNMDNPPSPEDLNLNLGDTGFPVDMASLHWRLTGEAYNEDTGEQA